MLTEKYISARSQVVQDAIFIILLKNVYLNKIIYQVPN